MNPELTHINRNEVLKYLGYKGGFIDDYTNSQIDNALELVKKIAQPKVIHKVVNICFNEELSFLDIDFKPEGKDIANLLKESRKAILFVATLGNLFETELRKAQIKDMAFAVILDSCASSAIENICDNFQSEMEKQWAERRMFLTDRFSPGYGDMPLTQQKDFCMVLDSARKVGVTVNKGGLLVPTKSVTAIMGISKNPQPRRKIGCEHCKLFASCQFRKDGIICD